LRLLSVVGRGLDRGADGGMEMVGADRRAAVGSILAAARAGGITRTG
jgi:hypothetical protein